MGVSVMFRLREKAAKPMMEMFRILSFNQGIFSILVTTRHVSLDSRYEGTNTYIKGLGSHSMLFKKKR